MLNQEYKQLLKSLKMLAATSEQQIIYLKELGTFPSADELALEFDDAFKLFKGKIDEIGLSEFDDIVVKVNEVNSLLKLMSERVDLWSTEALEEEEWGKLRNLANHILKEIPK